MANVLNLKIATGRSDVYYPNLRPIIVNAQVDVNVAIDVDPDTQETLITISSSVDDFFADTPILPFDLSNQNFLILQDAALGQLTGLSLRNNLYSAGANIQINEAGVISNIFPVPDAPLLGAADGDLLPVTLGNHLDLTEGVLAVTLPDPIPIPNADLLGGLDNNYTAISLGARLSLTDGILSADQQLVVPDGDLLAGFSGGLFPVSLGITLANNEGTLDVVSGNIHAVADALQLTNAFTLTASGDVSGAVDINGASNVSLNLTLRELTLADLPALHINNILGAANNVTLYIDEDGVLQIDPAQLIGVDSANRFTVPIILTVDGAIAGSVEISGNSDVTLTASLNDINGVSIGLITPDAGKFTTLDTTGVVTLGDELNFAGHLGVNLGDPVDPLDAVNKRYVDSMAQGFAFKPHADAVYIGVLGDDHPFTYDNGASGVGATITANQPGALISDTITLTEGMRLLINGEYYDPRYNGLYIVTQAGDVTTPFILTRDPTLDQPSDFPGALIIVTQGQQYVGLKNSMWLVRYAASYNVGVDEIHFVMLNPSVEYLWGTGLQAIGSTIEVAFGKSPGLVLDGGYLGAANGVASLDSSGKLTLAQLPAFTFSGDVTGSGTNNITLTLADVVSAGTYNRVTVDAKGRITAGTLQSYLTANQNITISGDASGSGTTAINLTLASVATPGTFNSVTIDAKGRVTAGSNQPYLTANQTITISGDASGSGATAIALTLANVISPGTYNMITVDAKGRVTSGSLVDYSSGATVTLTGDITGSGTGTIATTLANIVTGATHTKITYNAKGQVTAGSDISSADITDFLFASLADNQIIRWDAGSSKFVNSAITYAMLPSEVQNVPIALPYDSYSENQVRLVAITQAMQLPANFSGTYAIADTAATGSVDFTIQRQRSGVNTTIGTVTLTPSGFTLSTQAAANFIVGDALRVVAPASVDATLANFCLTLVFLKQ